MPPDDRPRCTYYTVPEIDEHCRDLATWIVTYGAVTGYDPYDLFRCDKHMPETVAWLHAFNHAQYPYNTIKNIRRLDGSRLDA